MLSNLQRNIILRALHIRRQAGEKPEEILIGYTKLSEAEKADILRKLETEISIL